MNTENNTLIHIKAIQSDAAGNKNNIEFFTEGKCVEKDGCTYLTYKESELSGMEGTTSTIKIAEDTIVILRFGAVASKFEYKKGIKSDSLYKTPFGSFDMTVSTRDLKINQTDDGSQLIMLKYNLEIDGQGAFANELEISYKKH